MVSGPVQENTRLLAVVQGHVQGVGFRWWTRCRARELGLVGHAGNLPDGTVEVSAQGRRQSCQRLLDLLDPGALPVGGSRRRPGRVDGVAHEWLTAVADVTGFVER